MKWNRMVSIWVMAVFFVTLFSASSVMAYGPGSDTPEIEGPEYWGVIVVDCVADHATLRVKRIVNCDVEVDLISRDGFVGCPTAPGASLGWTLDGATIFGDDRVPIITKEKNWKQEQVLDPNTDQMIDVDVFSMDVQIRFVKPTP